MRRIVLAGVSLAVVAMLIPGVAQAQNTKKGDRYRITAADLAEVPVNVNTALDLVMTMRPLWANPPRGRTASAGVNGDGGGSIGGATEVQLYIDEIRQPSVQDLRTVKASDVVEMRFLEQNRAVQMRGPGHELGVIEVTTKNKRR